MQISNLPSRISKPFAESGTKNTIPVASQIGVTPGAASYTDGFPPLTRTPLVAGGIPPFGEDMNGILYAMSALNQWQSAGGQMTYDSAFSTAIGGYPKGATLQKSGSNGFWISTTDNNTTNPDSGGAGWVDLFKWNIDPSAGGTADAITASFPLGIATWAQIAGVPLFVRASAANITSTPTFTANNGTLASKIIVKGANSPLVAGDIAGAGNWVCVQYDTVLDRLVLANPATGVVSSSIQGAFKNLQASATGTSATISVSADEITLEDTTNSYKTVRSISLSVAGTSVGANGIDTGTIAASTWYSLWIINNGTTTAGLLSLSSTAPTLPSGYTFKTRVGWIRTDATGNKFPFGFTQKGRLVQYLISAGTNLTAAPIMASGTAGTVNSSLVSVAIGNYFPSTAAKIAILTQVTVNQTIQVSANSTAGIAGGPGFTITANSAGQTNMNSSLMLESSNIYWASTDSLARLYAFGWEDNL